MSCQVSSTEIPCWAAETSDTVLTLATHFKTHGPQEPGMLQNTPLCVLHGNDPQEPGFKHNRVSCLIHEDQQAK